MTNTIALLDKARELCSPPTDYRLAKTLEISPTTISRCRKHGGTLDNEATLKLAKFLQQDFTSILALVELDRAKTEKTKQFWDRLAPRLVPSLVIGLLATATPEVSRASQLLSHHNSNDFNDLYIMRSSVWRSRRYGRRSRDSQGAFRPPGPPAFRRSRPRGRARIFERAS